MSRKSPKHARRTVRRSSVAVGAIAATAALTVATPATAGAAPTGIPQLDQLLAVAPLLPGGIPLAVIPQVAPQINQGVAAWNQIPVLSGLVPVSNATANSTILTPTTPLAPGWVGAWSTNTFSVGAPLGLGGLTNTTYGLVGLNVIPGQVGYGSIGGNNTTLSGPLGSALGLQTSLSAVTTNGLTTWTPSMGLNAVAPLGLGTAGATIVPVTVTYGTNTFLVGLPAVNLGFAGPLGIGGNLVLNLGQIGFQNGNLVLVTPSIGGGITTSLGGGSVGVTPGTVTVGTGGVTVEAPDVTGSVNVLNTVTANLNVNGGGASITPAGASVTGPSGTATGGVAGVGSATVSGTTGNAQVGPNGGSVTGPTVDAEVTTPVGSGGGHAAAGSASVNTNTGTATVTGPSGGADVSTPVGGGSVEAAAGSATIDTDSGTASVTGPSGVASVTAGGDTTTVAADTGAVEVDSSGDVDVTDTPSVDVT